MERNDCWGKPDSHFCLQLCCHSRKYARVCTVCDSPCAVTAAPPPPSPPPPPPPPYANPCHNFQYYINTEIESANSVVMNLPPSIGNDNLNPENCCKVCVTDGNCGGFTVFYGTCYFKSGTRDRPASITSLQDRHGYMRIYAAPPLPPFSPPLPPAPLTPPGGTFEICSGSCLLKASVLPSSPHYNWIVGESQSLQVDTDWVAGDVFVRGNMSCFGRRPTCF